MGNEVNFRIQCGWNNWRRVSGVISDRPASAYGLEAAPLKKSEEKKMDVA